MKSIDQQISDTYTEENEAITSGNRTKVLYARIARRTLKSAKKNLVAREDLPATDDPSRPPKPPRPKPKIERDKDNAGSRS